MARAVGNRKLGVSTSYWCPNRTLFRLRRQVYHKKKTAQAAANNFRIKFYNLLRNKLGKICDGFLRVDSFQKKECVRHSADEKSK